MGLRKPVIGPSLRRSAHSKGGPVFGRELAFAGEIPQSAGGGFGDGGKLISPSKTQMQDEEELVHPKGSRRRGRAR